VAFAAVAAISGTLNYLWTRPRYHPARSLG
jgi:hypothetical protein